MRGRRRETARRLVTLARWLGPWTQSEEMPLGILRVSTEVAGRGGSFEAWVYFPRGATTENHSAGLVRGAVLLVPGLHFRGPEDPRFDRFSRVLADAGYLVLAPFLPSYRALRVEPEVVFDINASFDALLAHPALPRGTKPGVFSISFGSMPALRLAAMRGEEIERVVVFGGFANFAETIHFALHGKDGRVNDPLNAAVVLINVLPFLGEEEGVCDDADRALLREAWMAFCRATWGRSEMKKDGAHKVEAERLVSSLPAPLQQVFLLGCRARDGVEHVASAAIARSSGGFAWIDPRVHFPSVKAPVTLVHGVDDDVIPFEQSLALRDALCAHTRAELFLTGLYSHTQAESRARRPKEVWSELRAMQGILLAMARLSFSSNEP